MYIIYIRLFYFDGKNTKSMLSRLQSLLVIHLLMCMFTVVCVQLRSYIHEQFVDMCMVLFRAITTPCDSAQCARARDIIDMQSKRTGM